MSPMDDELWDFVLGALSICTIVRDRAFTDTDRAFTDTDLYGNTCILWRTAYGEQTSITYGGEPVDLRREILSRFHKTGKLRGTICGNPECLNPQHVLTDESERNGRKRRRRHNVPLLEFESADGPNVVWLTPMQQYFYKLMVR